MYDLDAARRLNAMPLNSCIELMAAQERQAQAERAQRAASTPSRSSPVPRAAPRVGQLVYKSGVGDVQIVRR